MFDINTSEPNMGSLAPNSTLQKWEVFIGFQSSFIELCVPGNILNAGDE